MSETLLVAGLTALGYWIAFLYQASYLYYFYCPVEFVDVNLQSILVAVLALGVLFIGFWTIDLVAIFSSDDPRRQRFIFPGVVFPIWFWALIIYFPFSFIFLLLFVPVIFVVLRILLTAWLSGNPWNRAVLWEQATRPRGFIQGLTHAFGPRAYGLTAIVVLLTGLSGIGGIGEASRQKVFFVFSEHQDLAVIRIYSDRLLAIPFDRATKTARPELIIVKIDQNDIRLTRDPNVGPLRRPDSDYPQRLAER